MNDPARHLLLQIIHDYSIDIANDPQRLNALLKDYAQGQYKREIFLCVQAVREGVAAELQNYTQAPLTTLVARLVKRLCDDCGFDTEASTWTVETWLAAFDLLDEYLREKPQLIASTRAPRPKPTKLSLVPMDPEPVKPADVTFVTHSNVSWLKKLIEAPQHYLDNGNGTVTDKRTGLLWMRASMGQRWNGAGCDYEAKEYTLSEALEAVKQLNLSPAHNCGYYDWRVPSVEELSSIREPGNIPVIDTKAFPNTPNGRFWTTSERETVDENGHISHRFYTVNFNSIVPSHSSGTALPSNQRYVRLVRGPVKLNPQS